MRKILSVSVAQTFLVSSAGIFIVKHTCLYSGKKTIFLGARNNCCDHQAGDGYCPVHGDHSSLITGITS